MHDIFSPSFQTLFDRAITLAQPLAVQRRPRSHLPQALKQAFDSDSPVIIEKYSNPDLDENACCRELASRFGSVEVRIRAGDLASPQEYSNERIYESSTLADYLVEMFENRGRPRYAGNIRLPTEILSIAGVTVPNCVPVEDLEPPSYWFGGTGCITPLHKDSTDNFAVQVFGRKRWTIFPVRDAPNLYLSRPSDEPLHDYATSLVDWRSHTHNSRF